MIALRALYDFGSAVPPGAGNGNALLGAGWASPEPRFVWSVGTESLITLAVPRGAGRLAIELTGKPFLDPPTLRHQHLSVVVNGQTVAERRSGGLLTWWIDVPEPPAGAPLTITLRRSPAPRRPRGDPRDLGFRLDRLAVLRDTTAPAPPPARALTAIPFSWNEPTDTWLGEGWGSPEDHYVWSIGAGSTMRVPVPPDGAPQLAILDMLPFQNPHAPVRQRVEIFADDRKVAALDLRSRLMAAVELRPAAGQTAVTLRFRNLDADYETTDPLHHFGKPFAWFLRSVRIVPALPRYLAGFRPRFPGRLADGSMQALIHQLTGLDAADLAAAFESMGNGCELGLLQQAMDRERSGLLRFTGITQRDLVEGLFRGFHGVARRESLVWAVRREEDDTWRLIDGRFGLSAATPYSRHEPPPPRGLDNLARSLPRLAEKMMEDVAEAERIFVLRFSERGGEEAARAVLAALRHYGEADMLWLVTDGSRPPGCVERLESGLLRGHLEAADSGRPIAQDTMMSTLANALILLRQAQRLAP